VVDTAEKPPERRISWLVKANIDVHEGESPILKAGGRLGKPTGVKLGIIRSGQYLQDMLG
jgi:hypothetical protein